MSHAAPRVMVWLCNDAEGRSVCRGPYLEVHLGAFELRGRTSTLHTELVARWGGHEQQWIGGDGTIYTALRILPITV